MFCSKLILVNKYNPLKPDYVPEDLIEAPIPFDAPAKDPKRLIRQQAYEPLKFLYLASRIEGLNLTGISAYRSYFRQKEIYENSIKEKGLAHAQSYIAFPGTSEHQTGLAIDLSTPTIKYDLIEDFANTYEGVWLKEHAHEYGFIIRYPKGKEYITGYEYEPWHIRYVGRRAAKFMYKHSLVLEEFLKSKSNNCNY